MVETILESFFEALNDIGYEHKPYDQLTPAQEKWYWSEEGQEFEARLRRGDFPPEVLSVTQEITLKKGVNQDYQDVRSGKIEELKQAGLYVDALDGEVSVEPTTPTQRIHRDLCRKWLDRAVVMSERALQDASGGGYGTYRFVTVLKDELLPRSHPRP